MRKFTVFTVLLTIVVMVVIGQLLVDKYLPNLRTDISSNSPLILPSSLSTNILGSDLGAVVVDDNVVLEDVVADDVVAKEPVVVSLPEDDLVYVPEQNVALPNDTTPSLNDFEDPNFATAPSATTNSVYLRDEQIKSAGFVNAYIEKEAHNGLLFKSIAIDDLTDTDVEKNSIRTDDAFLAKVYIFKVGIISNSEQVYELLKMKALNQFGVNVNETNDFGSKSFYMNDSKRSGTVFLTVEIGATVYAFSYPKEYHSQVKNLIQLLVWELG